MRACTSDIAISSCACMDSKIAAGELGQLCVCGMKGIVLGVARGVLLYPLLV